MHSRADTRLSWLHLKTLQRDKVMRKEEGWEGLHECICNYVNIILTSQLPAVVLLPIVALLHNSYDHEVRTDRHSIYRLIDLWP